MNINKILVASLASAALLFTACSKDEAEISEPATPASFSIAVADPGYASADSRAEENGFATRFTSGDRIGVYAVLDGSLVAENICFTATVQDGKVVWTNDQANMTEDKASYFAYYPYDEAKQEVNLSATTAGEFFANKIAGWAPAKDQNDQSRYTAADLMTAAGVVNNTVVSFNMEHQMSMLLFKFPETAEAVRFEGITPYATAESFRLLVKPESGMEVAGSFRIDNGAELFSFTAAAAAKGQYKTFTIAKGEEPQPSEDMTMDEEINGWNDMGGKDDQILL